MRLLCLLFVLMVCPLWAQAQPSYGLLMDKTGGVVHPGTATDDLVVGVAQCAGSLDAVTLDASTGDITTCAGSSITALPPASGAVSRTLTENTGAGTNYFTETIPSAGLALSVDCELDTDGRYKDQGNCPHARPMGQQTGVITDAVFPITGNFRPASSLFVTDRLPFDSLSFVDVEFQIYVVYSSWSAAETIELEVRFITWNSAGTEFTYLSTDPYRCTHEVPNDPGTEPVTINCQFKQIQTAQDSSGTPGTVHLDMEMFPVVETNYKITDLTPVAPGNHAGGGGTPGVATQARNVWTARYSSLQQ